MRPGQLGVLLGPSGVITVVFIHAPARCIPKHILVGPALVSMPVFRNLLFSASKHFNSLTQARALAFDHLCTPVGILPPSRAGCGKSTLLEILAGRKAVGKLSGAVSSSCRMQPHMHMRYSALLQKLAWCMLMSC